MGARSTLGVICLFVVLPGTLLAGPTALERCKAAKIKAAGQKVLDKAKCQQRAILRSAGVDPVCLTKAETKFAAAMARADALGCPGKVASMETKVDACVTTLVESLNPVCCYMPSNGACTWAPDAATCQSFPGSAPGAPGSVCDSQSGSCVAMASAGPCCSGTTNLGGDCAAGPGIAGTCTAGGGTLSSGVCPSFGGCTP